ncbi:hypothetical protein QR680_008265 [Steinernema hermaphroditum]|uniref:USP domain-containing protein n=1 Tax=Steinernema hermaphroditum TaxID=289476 RepID=A0AA39IG14_9BILA|nr:hypothetical protein QR680_008265 [Steinernema hermaphroditum]
MKFPSASRSTAALAVAAKKSLKRKHATAPSTATAVMSQAYHSSSKYKQYVAAIEKALKQFENTTEWADLISALAKLHKVIASNVKFREIPKPVAVSKRLAQCLHPALPAGVHQKVLENYRQIFDVVGREELPKMLNMFAFGLFPLMDHCQIKVKDALMSVFEVYLLPLGAQLRPSLPGFIGAVLLGLEEGTEFYDRSFKLLNELCESVGSETFFGCLWEALLNQPKVRLPGLIYVNSKFEKHAPMDNQLFIMGHHIDHAISALCEIADDHGSALVQRHLLDFLCSAFPLNSDHVVQADLVQIMRRCLFVVLRRDASLNRRLFNWFLNKSGSSDNPLKEKEEDEDIQFFNTYTLPLIKLAVEEYLKLDTVEVATTQSIVAAVGGTYDSDAFDLQVQFTEVRVCRMLSYFLDRGQLGHLILEGCLAMFLEFACKHDAECSAEINSAPLNKSLGEFRKATNEKNDDRTRRVTEIAKNFNVLLNNLEANYLWQFLSRLFENLLVFADGEPGDELEQTIEEKQKREHRESKRQEHLKLFPSMVSMCIKIVHLDSHGDIRGRYLAELLYTVLSNMCLHGCDKFGQENLVELIAVCQMLLSEISQRSIEFGSPTRSPARDEARNLHPYSQSSRFLSVSDSNMSDQEKIEKCLETCKKLMTVVCDYYTEKRDVRRVDVLQATTALLRDFSEFSIFWFGNEKEAEETEPKNFWQQFFGAPRQRSTIPQDIVGSEVEPAWLRALINVIDLSSWMTDSDKTDDFEVRAMVLDLIVYICVRSQAVIETHEAVVGRSGSYLYGPEKTTTTILLRPFVTQVALQNLDSSEFFQDACQRLWDCLLTPQMDPSHLQSACRLLLLLHSRKPTENSSKCEDIIIGELTHKDVGIHCRAAQKFSAFWSLNRQLLSSSEIELFPGLNAKPMNKVLIILLSVIAEGGINPVHLELGNVAKSWLVECAKHNDLPRILEMLCLHLWSPSTSRVSIQYVQIQSRCNHNDLSAMPSGLNDVCLKTANSRKTLHHMCAEDGFIGDFANEDVLFAYMNDHKLLNELRKRLLMSPTTESVFQQEPPMPSKTHKRTMSDIPNFDDDNISNDESFGEGDGISIDSAQQAVYETVQFLVDAVVEELDEEEDPNRAFYEVHEDNVSVAESTVTARSRSSLPPKLSIDESDEVEKKFFGNGVAGGVRPSASSVQLTTMTNSNSNESVVSVPASRSEAPTTTASVKRVKTGHRRQDSLQESIFSMTTQELRLFDAAELPKNTAPGDGKQPLFDELHAHMLLYEDSGRSVDLGRCEEVFRMLSSLIRCQQSTKVGRMIVNCMVSSGTANLITGNHERSPMSCPLGDLVARHTRSIQGYDFFPEAGSDLSGEEASVPKSKQHLTFLEIGITAALHFLRSYFLNSPVTPVYEEDLTQAWKCKIAALEFLTDLVRELRSMVKEQQSKAFVAYLHAILTKSKLQRCLLHLLLGIVHAPSTSAIGMSPLSVQIASFNIGPRKHQRFDFLISKYHRALLDLTSIVIGMEYEIKNGFQNYVEHQVGSITGYMDKMSINHQVYNSPQIRSTVREPHVCIVELRLFLVVVLNALKKRPEKHSIWLEFLVSILPYLDRSLPTVVVHVVEQLCKNLDTAVIEAYPAPENTSETILFVGDSISMRSTPTHTSRNMPSNGHLNAHEIPANYGIMTLETLATMLHYCLIDSTVAYNSPSILPGSGGPAAGGMSSSGTSGWSASGAASSLVGSAISVIPGTFSSLMKALTFSDSGTAAAVGPKDQRGNGVLKQARAELMRTFPHALSTICDVWAATKRRNNVKIPIGNREVLSRMIIELLSPIAQNHQQAFLSAVAMVWLTRSEKQKRCEHDQPSFAYSNSQNDIADLISSMKVLPFESLISTVTDSLKEYGTKSGKLSTSGSEKQSTSSFPTEVSLLELLHACIRHSQAAIKGCWTALHTMISEAPLSQLPPRAIFLQFMILVDFVKISGSPAIIEDKQLSRSIQDACQKLTDAVNMIVGWQLEQPTWLKRTLVVKQDTGSLKSIDLSPTVDFSTTPGSLLASESNSIKGSTTSLTGGSARFDMHINTGSQANSSAGGFEKKGPSNLRSSLKDSAKRDPSISTQALFLLAENLAELVDSISKSEDKEKLLPSITNVWNNTLPFLKSKHTRNARFFLAGSQFLASMSTFNYMRSVWRKSVVELIGDIGFFKMDKHALKQWLTIVDHLTTQDKSSFKEILSATTAPSTGIGIMSNKESEYDHRASVLKRLAFVILSAERDQFQTLMPDIQERLADNLRLNHVPGVHNQVFLCFRVLLLRSKPSNLISIWPAMISELMSVLMLMEQELTAAQAEDSKGVPDQTMQLYLSASKLLETLCTLPRGHLPQYQMCSWGFVSTITPSSRDLFTPHANKIHELLSKKYDAMTDAERHMSSASLTGIKTLTDFRELRPFFHALANQHRNLPGDKADLLRDSEALCGSLSLKTAVTHLEHGLYVDFAEHWHMHMRNGSPPSSKDNSAPTLHRREDDVKGGLRGGDSNGAAAPEAQVDDSDGIDWIARHSAYMDLRVRAKLRKSYEEVNDEEDGFENTSADAEIDADSDWSERRTSKRVAKKRERYSPAENFEAGEPKPAKVAKNSAPPKSARRPATKRRKPPTANSLIRRRPTGVRPRGIDNPDLTCYVNAVLQSFFCNDSVKEYLLNLPDAEDLFQALNGEMNSVLIVDEFRKVMRALSRPSGTVSEDPSRSTVPRLVSSISASTMMTEVRKIMPEFIYYSHCDSHEFLIKTTNRMHEELLRLSKKSDILTQSTRQLNNKLKHSKVAVPASDSSRTMISAYFQGTLETTKVCQDCGTVSTTDETFQDLVLPILSKEGQTFNSIDECIATYFTHDNDVEDVNGAKRPLQPMISCPQCVGDRPATKSTLFKIPPLILCVQLRRYNNSGKKIDTSIKFPIEGMNLTHYVKIPSRAEELAEDGSSNDSYGSFGAVGATRQPYQYVYSLFSIICHRGQLARHGHYLSYGKTGGDWYCFNDTRVRPCTESEIMRQKPYILFYRREIV